MCLLVNWNPGELLLHHLLLAQQATLHAGFFTRDFKKASKCTPALLSSLVACRSCSVSGWLEPCRAASICFFRYIDIVPEMGTWGAAGLEVWTRDAEAGNFV